MIERFQVQCLGMLRNFTQTVAVYSAVKWGPGDLVLPYGTSGAYTLYLQLPGTIDNRVLKRDRKRNNMMSQNTYISIGILCSTSRIYSLRLLRLYQRETNCCNDRIL